MGLVHVQFSLFQTSGLCLDKVVAFERGGRQFESVHRESNTYLATVCRIGLIPGDDIDGGFINENYKKGLRNPSLFVALSCLVRYFQKEQSRILPGHSSLAEGS